MKHRNTDKLVRANTREPVPKLIPTGSLNKVLLIGGKNLSVFQRIGLIFIGICASGIGGSLVINEFRTADHLDFYLLLLGVGMITWGVMMIANGISGIIRKLRKAG